MFRDDMSGWSRLIVFLPYVSQKSSGKWGQYEYWCTGGAPCYDVLLTRFYCYVCHAAGQESHSTCGKLVSAWRGKTAAGYVRALIHSHVSPNFTTLTAWLLFSQCVIYIRSIPVFIGLRRVRQHPQSWRMVSWPHLCYYTTPCVTQVALISPISLQMH